MATPPRFLVFGGATGWIGGLLVKMLEEKKLECHCATSRLENRSDVAKELDEVRPTHVLNAAGLTGRPNVDWCEDHKEETIRVNVIGTLSLYDLCHQRKIHLTSYASGCIYAYDDDYPEGGRPRTELDTPNFTGSFYSMTKGMVEKLIPTYTNALTLRLRMPISDDLHPRSLITKLTKYSKITCWPNSVSVLSDLLPVSIDMALQSYSGIYNFTNPGATNHNILLGYYKQYVDPSYQWVNTKKDDALYQQLLGTRSNCELDCSKLLAAFKIPHCDEALPAVFQRIANNTKNKRQKTDDGQ